MATARPALLASIVVLLVAAVLAAGAAGPVRRAATPTAGAETAAAQPVRTPPAVIQPSAAPKAVRSPVRVELSGPSILVGLLLVVLALAVGLARVLRQRGRPAPSAQEVTGPAHRPTPLVRSDLRPVLASAAGRGLTALARARGGDCGDAIIRCWLSLEAAADRVGTRRLPAQTPTEFTVAVLARHQADGAAVAELLGLYHRARFGTRPLDDGAATRAAMALERIASSLQLSVDSSLERSAHDA